MIALPICTAPPERLSLSLRQFGRAERGAVNAVAAGAAADGHDQVAGLRLLERLVARDQADVAAVDQRVAQVARVEVDRAVDGGNAHPVAVVAHAGDDALASRAADAARRAAASSAGVSGGAKQKTSVLQIGLAPRPVPSGSRITPPMPVLAPP